MANSSFRLQPTDVEQCPDREVFAGWDEDVTTYYADVYNGVDANGLDNMDLAVGRSVMEIPTVDELVTALSPYAEIPDGFPARLEDSRISDTWTYEDLRPDTVGEDINDSLSQLSTKVSSVLGDAEHHDNAVSAKTTQQDPWEADAADESYGEGGGLNSGLGY